MCQAFGDFNDADMQWLELERLRVLSQNGTNTVIMPLDEGHNDKAGNRTNGKRLEQFQDLPLVR